MKIAICFSGAIRSFKYCWPSIYKNLVEPLKADIFLHTWKINRIDSKLDVKFKFTKDLCSDAYVIEKLKPIKYIIEKYDPEMESKIIELCKMKNADFSIIPKKYRKMGQSDKDCYKKYAHNAMGMYYKIMKCNELKKLYESEMGFKYDVVIRARLDFIWERKMNLDNFGGLKDGDIVILKDSYVSKGCLTNDRFFYGNSQTMDKFCELFGKIRRFYDNGISVQGSDLFEYYLKKKFNYGLIGNRNYYYKFNNVWNIKNENKKVFIEISNELDLLICEYFLKNNYYVNSQTNNRYLKTYEKFGMIGEQYDYYIKHDNSGYIAGDKNILLRCKIVEGGVMSKNECNINKLAQFIYYFILSDQKNAIVKGSNDYKPIVGDEVIYNTWEKESKIKMDLYCIIDSIKSGLLNLRLSEKRYTKYQLKLLNKYKCMNKCSVDYITFINVHKYFKNGMIMK